MPIFPSLAPEELSRLEPDALPDGVRRQVVRYLLRWASDSGVLVWLAERDAGPRDGFDRCRALIAAGRVEAARDLSRELVNTPGAGPWGHRAVGEVFLALGQPHRADERFRAGEDPVGRARAWLAIGDPESALGHLRGLLPEDPDAGLARAAMLRARGGADTELEAHLSRMAELELSELREALGVGGTAGPLPADAEGLCEALRQVFGYEAFRPGQAEVILSLLEGRSVLGLMPTGAGKSICFQLPAALLPGATVVISPLIALMKDQLDGLPPRLYRRAALINSSLEPGEAERRLEAVARGEVSLIYAAPERLRQWSFVRALQRRGVSLFVVDEAHCVSLWGHDFRPDYLFIRRVLADLGRPTVLALTATATPEMQDDIARQLDTPLRTLNLGTFRPNLALSVRRLPAADAKWAALQEALAAQPGPAIVYVDRRKLAEELAARLRQEGVSAEPYHAGLDREVRDTAQRRFMLGEVRVMTATVAFGMGVDKADVRLVVHYNLPRSLEAYYQEAGRAGRDGLPARCVLVYTAADRGNLTRRTALDRIQAPELLAFYRWLQARLRVLGAPPGIEELERAGGDATRARVALSLLQRLGGVDRGYDLPASVWFPARTAAPPGAPDALAAVLVAGGAVPLGRLAAAAGLEPERVEPLLLEWHEAGALRCNPGARAPGLRLAGAPAECEARIGRLLQEMEEWDRRRLELLGRYLEAAECRQAFVSRYFGGAADTRCGCCDVCTQTYAAASEPAARVAERVDPPLDGAASAAYERLRAWRRERSRAEGVPAYVVFHDRVLYAIARDRPRTLLALGQVPGVGPAKMQSYGAEVLALLR